MSFGAGARRENKRQIRFGKYHNIEGGNESLMQIQRRW